MKSRPGLLELVLNITAGALALIQPVVAQDAEGNDQPSSAKPSESRLAEPAYPYVPTPYGNRPKTTRYRLSEPNKQPYECIDAPPTVIGAMPKDSLGQMPCPEGQYAQVVLPPIDVPRGVVNSYKTYQVNPDGSSVEFYKDGTIKRFDKNGREIDEYGNPVRPEPTKSLPQASSRGGAATELLEIVPGQYSALVNVAPGVQNTGVRARLTVGQPEIGWFINQSGSDVFTLAQIAVSNSNNSNTVEFGWIVEPQRYDRIARLGLSRVVSGIQRVVTPSNLEGFVRLSGPDIGSPVSSTADYEIRHFDASGSLPGRWSVFFNGTEIGYFPDSVWSNNFKSAESVFAQGEIAATRNTPPCSDMGNGLGSPEANAATIGGLEYYDLTGSRRAFPYISGREIVTDPALYSFRTRISSSSTIDTFAYGGPGNGLCRRIGFTPKPSPSPHPTSLFFYITGLDVNNNVVAQRQELEVAPNAVRTLDFTAAVAKIKVEYPRADALAYGANTPKLCNFLLSSGTQDVSGCPTIGPVSTVNNLYAVTVDLPGSTTVSPTTHNFVVSYDLPPAPSGGGPGCDSFGNIRTDRPCQILYGAPPSSRQ